MAIAHIAYLEAVPINKKACAKLSLNHRLDLRGGMVMKKIVVNIFSLPVLCLHLPLEKDVNLVSLYL